MKVEVASKQAFINTLCSIVLSTFACWLIMMFHHSRWLIVLIPFILLLFWLSLGAFLMAIRETR